MSKPYKVNEASLWYDECEYEKKNPFLNMAAENKPLPKYSAIKKKLPGLERKMAF